MKDEIKEILEELKDKCKYIEDYGYQYKRLSLEDTEILLNYINSLEEDNTMYAQIKNEYEEEIKDLKQENQKLKETNVYCNRTDCVGRIKDSIKYDSVYQEKEHYKSRCEKAIEYIEKDTRWFDSEYARVYGELCDCAGAKGDRLEVMVNPSNALNILQNGSDKE